MKNKVIIGVVAVVIFVMGFFIGKVCEDKNHTFSTNDGINGVTVFENISKEIGYGIEFEEGEIPLNIAVFSGKLNLKITKDGNTVYEAEVESFENITINIPETGYYNLSISGEKATGIIKYPVSENTTSSIDEVPDVVSE